MSMMRQTPIALLMLGSLSVACGGSATSSQFAITHIEKRARLDNGLRMVVMPDKTTPLIQVDVRYEVGSKEDPPGKAGLAHLVEHMMFQHRFGPDEVPIEQRPPTFELLPQIATGFNAYTNTDTTHYYVTAPKEDLETVLRLEAARMATGCDLIPKEQFERELSVVRNEIRQRTGTAEGQQYQALLYAAYPEDHAYRETVGGNDQQLTSIQFEDVCKFMKDYYVPGRATVIVTGNVEPEEVGKQIQFNFGRIAAGNPAPRKKVEPLHLEQKKVEMQFDVERDSVAVMFAMPPRSSDEFQASQIMVFMLTSALNRFAQDWGLGNVQVNTLGGQDAPVMVVSVEVQPGKSANEVLDYLWKAAAGAKRLGGLVLENGEYQSEKISRIQYRQSVIESLEPLASRAQIIADMIQFDPKVKFDSDQVYIYQLLDRIDSVDNSRFEASAKRILDKKHAVVVISKANPDGIKGDHRASRKFSANSHEERPPPAIDLAEARRPLKAPSSDSILSKAERYELKNGMKVVLLPYQGLPIVQANLMFSAGSVHEPEDKSGLAEVAARFLTLPPGDAYGKTGISIGGRGGMDSTVFTGRGINIYLEVIIKGLERIVKAGYVPQGPIERYQKAFKDRFGRESYQRDYTFEMEVATALYGPTHPYVTKGSPTPKTLGGIGRDAASGFVRKHYSAANATLVVAGSFDVDKAKLYIKENFGGWGRGHKDENVTAQASTVKGPQYIGVYGKKQEPQMKVSINYPAPAGIDGQEAARLVLGEMLNQRMSTIRTKLGSTYGTYAGRQASVGPSAYQMGGTVDVKRAGESLKFMREQIDELRRGEGFEHDFVVARRIVLKQLLAQSTESYALAGRLMRIETHGLAPDYYDQLTRFVAAVPTAQVKALMASELDPNREIVVCMAGNEDLMAAFAEAGITNVRYVDPAASAKK